MSEREPTRALSTRFGNQVERQLRVTIHIGQTTLTSQTAEVHIYGSGHRVLRWLCDRCQGLVGSEQAFCPTCDVAPTQRTSQTS